MLTNNFCKLTLIAFVVDMHATYCDDVVSTTHQINRAYYVGVLWFLCDLKAHNRLKETEFPPIFMDASGNFISHLQNVNSG